MIDLAKKLDCIPPSRPIKVGDEVYIFQVTGRKHKTGTRYRALVLAKSGWTKKSPVSRGEYAEAMNYNHPLNGAKVIQPTKINGNWALAVKSRQWDGLVSKHTTWMPVVVSESMIEGLVEDLEPILQETYKEQKRFSTRMIETQEKAIQFFPDSMFNALTLDQAEAFIKVFEWIDELDGVLGYSDVKAARELVHKIQHWRRERITPKPQPVIVYDKKENDNATEPESSPKPDPVSYTRDFYSRRSTSV